MRPEVSMNHLAWLEEDGFGLRDCFGGCCAWHRSGSFDQYLDLDK